MRRVLIATLAGLCTGLLVAACAAPPHTPPPSTTTTTSTTTTSSTTTTTTTAPPPPSTTTRPAPPAVTTPPRPVATQCPPEIVALIEKHWSRFGPDVVQWAIGIAWRESNCRPEVTSPTSCAGLFQLAVPLHAGLFTAAGFDWRTAAWEAEPNVIVAANLYAGSGPSPWRL